MIRNAEYGADSARSKNSKRRASSEVTSAFVADSASIPFATAVAAYDDGDYMTPKGDKGGGKSSASIHSASTGSLRGLSSPLPQQDQNDPGSPSERESGNVARSWPAGLIDSVISSFSRPPNEGRAKAYLTKQNWPMGLQENLLKSCRKVPIRFFIVDDSGSMQNNDGRKILRTGPKDAKMVACTRWSELTNTLHFLAEISEEAGAPSEFRLLNGADPVLVGLGDDNGEGLSFCKEVLQDPPAGTTPLCAHITCVVSAIKAMSKSLKSAGQKAAVIILTDGEATDGSVTECLKPLEKLPVLMVVRLVTDAPAVVKYWDNIDKELELEMDVLDDLVHDAKQVKLHNPWIRYGDELHRLREFGASMKEMDLIDESCLGAEQMSVFASMFLGVQLPHPDLDFPSFLAKVKKANDKLDKIFDPLLLSFQSWIDIPELRRIYGGGTNRSSSCTIT